MAASWIRCRVSALNVAIVKPCSRVGTKEFHRPVPSLRAAIAMIAVQLGEAALGAEGPANIAADNPDLTWLDAELGSEPVLIP